MEMKCDKHGWLQARDFCHKCVADYLRAVNCHEELVKALDLVDRVSWPEDYGGWRCTFDDKEWQQIQGALAKAKEGTVDESQMLLQDLDEETL